ncbi:MAG TPA: TonB-dependent receptor [Cyclobacteriaceae bacterium]|nr:TonB-dependent receptor [Cyclobacteriaceae bacterium]
MMRVLCSSFIFLLIQAAYSQIITVIDKENAQPLELVTLSSNNPRAYVSTNENGQADISALKSSNRIEIRLLGYRTEVRSYAALEQLNFQISLVHSTLSLDQVVVSATRWSQLKAEIPSRISSIDAKEIALQNPQTAADMLEISGEVFIQKSQQGGGSPMIRGFATNRLLYTIDGVRMNTAIFRAGNIQNVISLDAFAIENTEVFFGPGSIIYGSDAIGGVMTFQTLSPKFSETDTLQISGSTSGRYSTANQEKTMHGHINFGGRKWAALSSFTISSFDDLRMGSHGPEEYLRPFYVERINNQDVIMDNDDPRVQIPSAYDQFNFLQKIRYKPNQAWDFQYGFHYSETSAYGRYDRHIRYNNAGLPRSAEWNYGPQVWMMNNLNITHNQGNKYFDQMVIRLAHQVFEESRIDRNMGAVIRRIREEKVNALSANVDFIKAINAKDLIFYGVELVNNDVQSNGTDENVNTGIANVGPSRYPQATWASYALYTNYQHRFTDKLLMQSGLRVNAFSLDADFTNNIDFYPLPFTKASVNNTSVTGSLGLVYNASEQMALSINASTGFRAPNVDDMGKFFDIEAGAVVVPNPDLQAEYAYNIEAGIARMLTERTKFEMTAYYTLLDNALVRRDYVLSGQDSIVYDGVLSRVQAIQNAANANVYGTQVGIETDLGRNFSLLSRFNYQIGKEEMDDGSVSRSRHAAPWFGLTRLTYKPGKLLLQFYAQYSGEVSFENLNIEERGKPEIYASDENGNPYSPAWYTLNLKALFEISSQLQCSFGLENITDQRYRPYSSGIVSPGRNYIFALRANF